MKKKRKKKKEKTIQINLRAKMGSKEWMEGKLCKPNACGVDFNAM